ncbi:hypothetical protein IMG5_134190 [Ichthyophthirius multifiliis]|uniref:Transmembrane protein n=1 Tax=Ichthyophthirius multifiliis TaxID=5932 RepID=G0QWQ1_ICHMU|nr:hypothetical protein IMG5_134190 [Ichthyophthirius multifiliis]EGR30351.1 hypothetical protein IMG5_134190 [Ichthyophthirius multifiliis]|eukprot:XP_004031938.1 hypothetical protein IMG5_134190 [Ichthyophthirius multifiliis]
MELTHIQKLNQIHKNMYYLKTCLNQEVHQNNLLEIGVKKVKLKEINAINLFYKNFRNIFPKILKMEKEQEYFSQDVAQQELYWILPVQDMELREMNFLIICFLRAIIYLIQQKRPKVYKFNLLFIRFRIIFHLKIPLGYIQYLMCFLWTAYNLIMMIFQCLQGSLWVFIKNKLNNGMGFVQFFLLIQLMILLNIQKLYIIVLKKMEYGLIQDLCFIIMQILLLNLQLNFLGRKFCMQLKAQGLKLLYMKIFKQITHQIHLIQ